MMTKFDSMKKKINPGVLFFTLILLFLLIPGFIYAQIGDPGGDVDLPIDGGLSILVAAGVGYGIKKIRDEKKNSRNNLL
jgi:hypothetical protein